MSKRKADVPRAARRRDGLTFIAASELNGNPVEVYGRVTGQRFAEFECFPNGACRKPSRIVIGLGHPTLWRCLRDFYHEVFEMALHLRGHRYERSGDVAGDAAAYFFWMTHEDMGEVAAQIAWFMHKTQRHVESAWRKKHKS